MTAWMATRTWLVGYNTLTTSWPLLHQDTGEEIV
eukprot:CAMPEP_0183358418 /NCGR_PEP_ID=MMETSP0164_2-20130417/49129_1 /TAXON_ID=221442 /ORGANISM="Coccolithus pelagicus ssp braarudi, Strain PLY182g" /LENGTH=33 /DNA_ID= /DNA_START= /DNA_END= /DNA_ORIENTATION=